MSEQRERVWLGTPDPKAVAARLRSKATDCHASEEALYLEAAAMIDGLSYQLVTATNALRDIVLNTATIEVLETLPPDMSLSEHTARVALNSLTDEQGEGK